MLRIGALVKPSGLWHGPMGPAGANELFLVIRASPYDGSNVYVILSSSGTNHHVAGWSIREIDPADGLP